MSARPRRRSGNLSAAKIELWGAIKAASAVITDPDADPELKLKAASVVGTCCGVYVRLVEGTQTEDRVAEMERAIQSTLGQAQNGNGTRQP